MAILPANIAFYLILAIIPLLTIVVLIASYFDISVDLVAHLVQSIMPDGVSDIIIEVISGKGFDKNVGLFNVIAFILASNGTYAIITTSNTLYKIRKTDYLKDRISSLILLVIIIVLFVFLLIVPIFGESIIKIMSNAKLLSSYADEAIIIFNILKWPVTLFIIYFNIKLIYAVSPSKNIKSEETTYGAMFTTIMWIIATVIFKFYITYFARYDILYGNLSTIIILMVWVFFLSYIFVLGMAINVSRKEEQELVEMEKRMEEERLELERLKKEKKVKKKGTKKKVVKKEFINKETDDDGIEIKTENTENNKK